ncbi:hypothetical protein CW298_1437 [Salmonella enterica subsp. enterica serovar Muenchen]|uniref:Uncharacterized protein n=7 Tax=Salmonella enterica I TaxID=59201 RepID=G5QU94_SALSE|nr:hypothetical protein SNSL254_A0055 [Salmonella enterica subsp. enterica serovar Newport str. SL254]ACH74062.1 hypothetical protein SeD_A0054 [Salmonella enterica subsp. enterica serovar Dublin str. CT_02021853]AET52511.1 hypothetical protein SPUL_0053 [Salmonella enterica subsp. enterica serovar Gallinarum/Pullorum str. RKS5078]AGU63008.1 hypothetical protein SPUCDC_0053 [Salmonella enterica subsp. enterica serovar Gallinarum/Pullorum str. CDC1983-67]AIE03978.1 hypothetical protein DC51_0054
MALVASIQKPMASNVGNPYFILPISLIPVGITTKKPATIVLVFQMNSKKVGH